MEFHKITIPVYYQLIRGEYVEVIQQRFYDKIEYHEILVNEQGLSKDYINASKKLSQ